MASRASRKGRGGSKKSGDEEGRGLAPRDERQSERGDGSGEGPPGAREKDAVHSSARASGADGGPHPGDSDEIDIPASSLEPGGKGTRAEPPFRGWAIGVLVVALMVGLGCAIHLTGVHLDAKYGDQVFDSLCDLGAGFNCSAVNSSAYSELFERVPVALLAIPVYALMLLLTILGWVRKDRSSLGAVAVFGLVSTLYSAFLAYVSAAIIHNFCLFCMMMYVVNILSLVMPPVAARLSLGASLGSGLGAVKRWRLVATSAVAVLLVSGVAGCLYSSAKDQRLAEFKDKLRTGAPSATAAGPGAVPDKKGNANTSGQGNVASSEKDKAGPKRPGPLDRVEVPIDDTIPFRGPSDAPVTVIVYDDFQCPFCRRLVGSLEQLLERYPKDVRLGLRHFPMHLDCNESITRSMHPNACDAAEAAVCAQQQGSFWPYYHVLFRNSANLSKRDLLDYARELRLDAGQMEVCMQDPATLEKVKADARTGGALGVTGTPTFYINGRRFSGALSIEMLSAIVDAELEGQTLTMKELRDVPKLPDIVGEVKTPEMVSLEGPYGSFEIDALEDSIVGGKAVSRPGVEAANQVTWFDADAACRASGKRLCTEAEWLTACQGAIPTDDDHSGVFSDDRLKGSPYPYGEFYKAGMCNDNVEIPKPATEGAVPDLPPLITGNHPECKSAAGVYDLTGNLREWVGTVPHLSAYIGGAFQSQDAASCGSRSESHGPFHKSEAIGFRCCRGGNVPEKVTHPGRQVGETMTPFVADTLEGKRFDSRSLKGKVSLITFWASWCRVCRQELPLFNDAYPDLHAKGFELIGINTDNSADKARNYLQEVPLKFPVVLDPNSELFKAFDTKGMPTSFLVDQKGRIRLRWAGFSPGDEKKLVETVTELLGGG